MHTLSDKVRFVQRKLKPEEAFRTKKWMVLAEHLLAQAHIYMIQYTHDLCTRFSEIILLVKQTVILLTLVTVNCVTH